MTWTSDIPIHFLEIQFHFGNSITFHYWISHSEPCPKCFVIFKMKLDFQNINWVITYRIPYFQNSHWDYREPLLRDDNDTYVPVIFEPMEEDRGNYEQFKKLSPNFFLKIIKHFLLLPTQAIPIILKMDIVMMETTTIISILMVEIVA